MYLSVFERDLLLLMRQSKQTIDTMGELRTFVESH